jgi:hypothetical protein
MNAETSIDLKWTTLGAALGVARAAVGIRTRLRHGIGLLVFAAAGSCPHLRLQMT